MGSSTHKTFRVHSVAIGKFVEFHKYSFDEYKTNILDAMSFDDMESLVYIRVVVQAMLVKPEILKGLPTELEAEVYADLFNLIVEEHPFVAIDKVKEVVSEAEVYEKITAKNKDRAAIARKIAEMRKHMYANVVGQREAIDIVVDAYARGSVRKATETRPIASLMFAGLSGVGKTEVAKQLAIAIRGSEDANGLIKIDCGEFAEAHYAARLTGSPSGYVGYEDAGLFEDRIDGGPQVVLFDEFEKGHPRLQQLLLSIMEDGVITMGNNEAISLSECIIILTSNLGAGEVAKGWEHGLGFNPRTAFNKASVRKAIEKHLPVEFVNRLDHICVFDELTAEQKLEIAKLELAKVSRGFDHMVTVVWNEEVARWMATDANRAEGARAVRKAKDLLASLITKEVLDKPRAKSMIVTIEAGRPVVRAIMTQRKK